MPGEDRWYSLSLDGRNGFIRLEKIGWTIRFGWVAAMAKEESYAQNSLLSCPWLCALSYQAPALVSPLFKVVLLDSDLLTANR
jgi:hypothetical protein